MALSIDQPDSNLTAIEFACIFPAATDTDLLRSISDDTALHAGHLRDMVISRACKPSQIAEGFLKLLRMPRVNRTLLLVDQTSTRRVKMAYVCLAEEEENGTHIKQSAGTANKEI
ncbi:hypothetical protein RRG08_037824 [Elysia crispata]|uniref:Uncharacterized protein n=1 Tax=Elysia crispata TaxID=231223 RepID=A0AAE1D5R5_9GAST|nr:hypothetical protein RRG08_037824 [Elysia crispata]